MPARWVASGAAAVWSIKTEKEILAEILSLPKETFLLVLSSVRTICCFFFVCHARLEAAGWKFTVCASGPEANAPISQARTEGTCNAEIIIVFIDANYIIT
jgi:hypothetical protein